MSGQLSGAIPIARRVRNSRRAATRVTVSIGVAVLVVLAPVAPVPTASASDVPPPDKTALIMGATSIPTPNDFYVEGVKNQSIEPTHPGQDIEYVAVTTPEEFWPITGLFRLIGLGLAAVDPHMSLGFVAAQFPPEPLWKLSGLFDLTFNQSLQAGVADLEDAMAEHGNDDLVIYGYSQGAAVANLEKRKLAEQYPAGTKAPDIDFVLGGDGNLPNGGLLARFPGLYIPILDASFNGPEPTDTQFHTDVIIRQYDGFADFPLYPINGISLLNAALGGVFVHFYGFDVSLADDASTSPSFQGTHGDSTYYFFETPDLPLFAPLRIVGVPESVIDVVEPFVREIVELGYDRSIPPWEPTPARLIPMHNPATVAADLVNAIGEGINNALAIIGSPAPLSIPAAPASDTTKAGIFQQGTSSETGTDTDQAMSSETGTDTLQAMSTKTGTGTGQATSTDTGTDTDQATSTAASASEPSTVSTSRSAKRADTPATHRSVVRGPLGVFGQQIRDRLHLGNGDQPTPQAAAVGDLGPTTAGPSSPASSSAGSSSAGSSSPGSSSGGDSAGRDDDGS